jgi:hypothetical protein
LLLASTCLPALVCAYASDGIVVNADRYRVETGRYSPFAVFQGNLQRILDDCGKGTPHVVAPGEAPHGRIGTETRLGVQQTPPWVYAGILWPTCKNGRHHRGRLARRHA